MNRVKIMGGLGNQFFQYAFAKEIEFKTGKKVQLTKDFYSSETNRNGGEIPSRVFLLDKFHCKYNVVPIEDSYRCSRVVKEMEFNPDVYYDDTYFVGYWQSESFFGNVKDRIKGDFRLKEKYIDDFMRETDAEMDNTESVSIHVRRTDYISLGIYPICSKDYFERAVKYLVSQGVHKPMLYVFSDDLLWCHNNLDGLCGYRTIFINTGIDYKDWYIMAHSKHKIISNSSFSFWAAYVGRDNDGIVVAPKKWAGSNVAAPTDVEGWKYI